MSNFNTNINNNNLNINSNVNSNFILQTLKRRTNKVVVPLDERVTLEKAYGFTITSNTRLTQSCDGIIAYLAGCVIVLYDPFRQSQDFIISPARKTLTTLAFSSDGKCIATGESGHDPRVRVWDVKEKVQICEFAGHKFSIECVCFSTNLSSNLIVSIGSMHDMVVNVWNLRTRFKVASNKIACKVKGLAFSRDGAYFVTVGNRHVKFWYLTVSSLMETVPLKGRAAILGELKNNYFCDVVCGSGDCSHLTYTITTNGILCEFNENRCLSRAIELHTERAYCIYADNDNLFIGCSNGAIMIFRQKNLEFIASLPRPHHLGVDIAKGQDTRHLLENLNNQDLKYPDCVALCYDKFEGILSTIYNDHSFYVWDIKDLTKVKKLDSHLFHSSCCWALDIYSPIDNNYTNNYLNNNLVYDSFITCGTDNTLRIWSPINNNSNNLNLSNNNNKLKQNIYSKELLKIIYIDNDMSALLDIDQSLQTSSADNADSISNCSSQLNNSVSSSSTITNLPLSSINTFNPTSDTSDKSASSKLGARCLKISPYGNHLATGDRNGNIKIFDLTTLESVCMIEAHDGEVLYLQYSPPESGRLLLASSSRDRLIHIFDASRNTYDLLQTLDDHSAAITAVRFCFNQIEKQLYVISCGADKSIMFRTANDCYNSTNNNGNISPSPNPSQSNQIQFTRSSYVAEKQSFYDLNLDSTRTNINTISQDRMIRTYSIKDGKKLRQFRGSLNEDGYLLKMDTDRNGTLLATSCTDKCVYVWDLNTCECVAYLYGHSEVVTDLKFTSDNQHLITVSGDGCIFVWKLNNVLPNNNTTQNSILSPNNCSNNTVSWSTRKSSLNMMTNNTNNSQLNSHCNKINQEYNNILDDLFDSDTESLPAWARNKLNSNHQTTRKLPTSTSFPLDLSKSIFGANSNNNTNKTNEINIESTIISQASSVININNDDEEQPVRKSRAMWGPVSETSFAIMVESDTNSLLNSTITSTTGSCISNMTLDTDIGNLINKENDEKLNSPNKNNNDNNDTLSISSSTSQSSLVSTSPTKDVVESFPNQLIQFPSPIKIENETNESKDSKNKNKNENDDLGLSLIDSMIKLDIDNSIRRQSISARYLMKALQQNNHSNNNNNHQTAETKSEETSTGLKTAKTLTPNFSISAAQMAADLLKIRRKASLLNNSSTNSSLANFSNATSSSATNTTVILNHNAVGNTTTFAAHTHHHQTDNTLNNNNNKSSKTNRNVTTTSLTINTATCSSSSSSSSNSSSGQTINNLQTPNSSSSTSSSSSSSSTSYTSPDYIQHNNKLKRSPSANSLASEKDSKINNEQDQQQNGSLPASSIIKIFNKSISVNSTSPSSVKPKNHQKTTTTNEELSIINKNEQETSNESSTNLKKAMSMISLFNSQIKQQQAKIMTGNAAIVPSASIDTTTGLNKKPRQIKQRSVERQLTSSSILSHIVASNLNRHTQNSPQHDDQTVNKNIQNNTTNAANNIIRKNTLSSSIQNLNNNQSNLNIKSNKFNIKTINFLKPTQSTSNKAIFRSSKLNSTSSLYDHGNNGPNSINTTNKLMHSTSISPPPVITSSKDDRMSSSGSSNNSDLNDLMNPSGNLIPFSSNSLTSSSSSSCSLDENKAGNNKIEDTNLNTIKFNEDNKKSKNRKKSNDSDGKKNGGLNGNGKTNFSCHLKKPITFASIAAANSNNLINTLNIQSPVPSNLKLMNSNNNSLTNEKIESILNEFKQNIYLLDLMYNQVS